jgi:formylglycine-generating enzyme required for sulfatase activity
MKQNTILYMIIFGLVVALAFVFLKDDSSGLVIETANAETEAIANTSHKPSQLITKQVQQALIDLGYQVPVNGVLEAKTIESIKDFETKNGLVVTGQADHVILKALRASLRQSLSASKSGEIATGSYQEEETTEVGMLKFQESNEPKVAKKEFVTLQDCASCPIMVAIPQGSFYMGSDDGEVHEKPVHKVNVKPFYMSQTEVTFDQWEACHKEGMCEQIPDDNGWGRGNRPVINVSWDDAKQYVNWLNKKTEIKYRLPSEAEWEYAALAGSNKKYAMGDEISCEQAKYGAFSGDCSGEKATAVVGSYPVNDFGLYDMHGNVWEWVEDCYHSDYYGAPKSGSVWKGNNGCKRVLRGGSWFVNADNLRAAYRLWNAASVRIYSLGFRVARD